MPLQLKLSQIKALPFDFDAEVEKFRQAKIKHALSEGEPAPSATHPWVEHAVSRVAVEGAPDDFVADHVVDDDTPPPPTFEERKRRIADETRTAAQRAMEAIIPPLKQRLWDRRHAQVIKAMGAVKANDGETIEAWRARALNTVQQAQPDDHAHYVAHEGRKAKIEAIIDRLAQAESDIHDLTEATIDSWKQPSFPA